MITIEQLRRARRREVTIGRFTFSVEQPTELRLFGLVNDASSVDAPDARNLLANGRIVKAAVIGWKGVRERDIVSSGTDDEEPFRRDLFEAWIEDRPDLWNPIVDAVFDMRRAAIEARQADEKN